MSNSSPPSAPARVWFAGLVAGVALAAGGDPAAAGPNQPPSVPVLRNPPDRGVANTTTPVFSWEASVDPDGDGITYELEVRDAGGRLAGVVGISGTVTSIAQQLENQATYSWRVRAVDVLEAASEFSPANTFVVIAPVDDPEVTVGGDTCAASADAGMRTSPWLVALAGLALARRRRRPRTA